VSDQRFLRAAEFLRGQRRWVVTILALTAGTALLSAAEPLVLKYVFDALEVGRAARVLSIGLGALIGLGLVREGLVAQTATLTWRTRLAVHQSLLEAMVARLHRLPLSFYRSEGVGAIMTRLERGVQGFVEAASQATFGILPALVYLLISIAVMFSLDWRLALVVLVLSPVPPLIAGWAAPVQTERERALLASWMRIYSRFNEVISGIVTVKSFTREEEEKNRFIDDVARANQRVLQGVAFDSRVLAGQNLAVTLARAAALGVGGLLVLRGETSVGTLVAFLSYVTGAFAPLQGLSGVYKTLRAASVSLDIVYEILDRQDQLGDAPDAVDPGRLRGEVEYRGVRFAYRADQRPILDGIDVRVAAGERLALVGPSGSGKSTMMALLQRFYDPVEGQVLVDGIDVRGVKQRALREQIGVVLQESLLFDDTIAANIAYGRPEASRAEIESVARAANAHDFISRLPEAYETMVGERGGRLSVGERQRVAIARALLKNPSILIFDEATSAVDAEAESLIQQAVDRLVRGRTTFVIAHRLATVVSADRVCVLRGGRITAALPHVELLQKDEYYAMLVERQSRGLLPQLPAYPVPRRRAEDAAAYGFRP
jgi:ATP-binding cassette subfamily B protein